MCDADRADFHVFATSRPYIDGMSARDSLEMKPADLPDLPIRARLALQAWPLGILLLSAVLFLALIRLSNFGDAQWLIIAICAGFVGLSALWIADRKRKMATIARTDWWRVTCTEEPGSLTFSWTPQHLDDLMPRVSPVILIGLIPTAAAGSQLPRLLHPAWPTSATAFIIFFVFIGLPALMVLKMALYARKQPDEKATAVLDETGARLEAPFARRVWRLTPWPRRWLRWASVTLRTDRIGAVVNTASGVEITPRQTRLARAGAIRIPTRDPDQRRAIAAWAARHGITVTGKIAP